MERFDGFVRRFASSSAGVGADAEAVAALPGPMDDDLDTPAATAELFELVTRANAAGRPGPGDEAAALAAAVFEMTGALGLDLGAAAGQGGRRGDGAGGRARRARQARDYGRADRSATRLQGMGWIVEDGPEGTILR